jgi:hypothetical protein
LADWNIFVFSTGPLQFGFNIKTNEDKQCTIDAWNLLLDVFCDLCLDKKDPRSLKDAGLGKLYLTASKKGEFEQTEFSAFFKKWVQSQLAEFKYPMMELYRYVTPLSTSM